MHDEEILRYISSLPDEVLMKLVVDMCQGTGDVPNRTLLLECVARMRRMRETNSALQRDLWALQGEPLDD